MKRGAPLRRSTPLRGGAPLRRTSLARTRPLSASGGGSRLRSTEPKRDWRNAIAKREREEGRCRVCGRVVGQGGVMRVEMAHVIGRKHDARTNRPGFDLWVNPLDVVPLCIRVDGGCHMQYDGKTNGPRLDLLPHLTRQEQLRAVELVGLAAAYKRITGGLT